MRIPFVDECGFTYTVPGTGVLCASAYRFLICDKFISLLQYLTQSVLELCSEIPEKVFGRFEIWQAVLEYIPKKYPTKFSTA